MGSKSYPKEKIVVFANGKVGRIDNFVKAVISGNRNIRKMKLSRIEQDKGFLKEYQYVVEHLFENIIGENIFNNAIDATIASFRILNKLNKT